MLASPCIASDSTGSCWDAPSTALPIAGCHEHTCANHFDVCGGQRRAKGKTWHMAVEDKGQKWPR